MGHDPPDDYRFNKLRTVGGSYRLTLVKAAVDNGEIDPGPPRPVFAHIPASEGVWVGFEATRFDSQRDRVAVREAVTAALDGDEPVVGEFPVAIRGKLGSAVMRVPQQLAERVDMDVGARITTVAVAPGLVLFATEDRIDADEAQFAAAIEAARRAVDDLDG